MNKTRVYGLLCVLFLAAFAAQATTIVLPSDEQLIAKAPVIVDGTVLSSDAVDRDGRIWTETVVSVARTIKGDPGTDTITVREIGGELGDRITRIFGTPEFEVGERVLLFLDPNPHGGFRTVDLFAGKFSEAKTSGGQRLWHRDDAAHDVTLLDAAFQPIEAQNIQRDAARFETFLHERLSGRAGEKNYGVANPILARDVADAAGRDTITSQFTLISEPTLYRWFRFDSGQSAAWYSSGTQPGYAEGGLGELRTAMASWTGYAEAKIYYSYIGVRSGSLGGLNGPNGANEVLFNDPLDEISGTYSAGAGGVVGTGGFNGVASQLNWTAPFAADASHPAGTLRAWNITEGNLTIQNGITSSNMSSKRLAEILSHEFGHTLGFGHSSDDGALMYYSVTGIGPALRADDQLAARWLYPNTGGPAPAPQAPAAPSSVTVAPSGNDVDVAWKDNATNETGFAIYLAAGNGTFSKVAEAAQNAQSAKLSSIATGSYRLYVIAVNGSGNSAQSNTVSFSVSGVPIAAFLVSATSGTAGVTPFVFTDQSTGTVSSRSWAFGDGTTSTQQNPTKIYTNMGKYTVTLTVTGAGGTSQASKIVDVGGPLSASFTYAPSAPKSGQTILFTDQSIGTPTSWQWTFGDGTTSSERNPSKIYAAGGNYAVKLTIMRDGQMASGMRVLSIAGGSTPVTPAVVATFDFAPSTPMAGANVTFTNTSTGAPTSFSWTFGDGTQSTSASPVHAFASAGVYDVTMVARNLSTTSTITRKVTVYGPYRTLLSAAAQTPGANGTSWRTELNLFNAGTQGATVTATFVPNAGGAAPIRVFYLAPRQSATYANAMLDLFGIESGSGAIALEATVAGALPDLRVTSRTYTTSSSGTYGQSVPNVQPESNSGVLFLTGVQASSRFRTNLGFVNRGSTGVTVAVTARNAEGVKVGATAQVFLEANTFKQVPLTSLFAGIESSNYGQALSIRLETANAHPLSAYASVVDNDTQDPIFIQAGPALQEASATIPVVGRAPGANGTFWRSDVTLHNPSTTGTVVTLRFGAATRTVSLAGRASRVVADVLQSEFGLTTGGGALQLTWEGAAPVITSRTYTTTAGEGTYGQSIEPVASWGNRVSVNGMRNDGSYRSNVGFANGGSETEVFSVTLLSPSGTELARTTLTLAAGQQSQSALAGLFPNVTIPSGVAMLVEGDTNARLFTYASMVDNTTGDPVFYAGR